MQIFFAISCLLAVLALSNGASVAPNTDEPRAEVEAQVAETAGQTRAVQVQATEQVASDGAVAEIKSTDTEETEEVVREKRHHYLRRKGCGGGCYRLGCRLRCQQVDPCLQSGGCGSGCGGANPCGSGCGGVNPCEPTNVMVVQRPVAVPTPVHIPVPVIKVVRHPVPVPQPIAVPVTKFVPVPVPVEQPCCTQPQPCCGQAPLPCSPCSG